MIHLLISAVITTVIVLMVAAAAARARFSASRGVRLALDIVFLSPLVLPLELIRPSICLYFGICTLPNLDPVRMLPILYFCAIAGFRNVNSETLEAAKLQGMGRCGTFWRFFVPTGWKWLLGGAALLLIRLVVAAVLFPSFPYA